MTPPRLRWDDPRPVFIDFETQSACDLKAEGGRRYALHETTRILSLVADIDGDIIVWFPLLGPEFETFRETHLYQAKLEDYGVDKARVWTHYGPKFPLVLRKRLCGRTLVAHNALGFDYFIWERFIGEPFGIRPAWADTVYLARAVGLPGGLDALASKAMGEGKDKAKLLVMPLTRAGYAEKDGIPILVYPPLMPGLVAPLLRYNVVDVLLMRKLWEGPLADLDVEGDVIETHVAVNYRGVQLDEPLLTAIQEISVQSMSQAAKEIERLTDGWLGEPVKKAKGKRGATNGAADAGPRNFRSSVAVQEWLKTKGVRVGTKLADGSFKTTLRKDAVEQCLADPELMLAEDSPFQAASEIDPVVFDVLRLRSAALRITGAKAERAKDRVMPDGRIYDLTTYHTAHTGRESSHGVQIHNLPRPKKGIDVEALLALHESGGKKSGLSLAGIRELLPPGKLTADDALAALIRPSLVARDGHTLLICDFAAVECRALGWLAEEDALLDIFAQKRDPYIEMASRIYGVPTDAVSNDQRQVGKIVVLGSGYGMGPEKFGLFAALSGIDLRANGTDAATCIDAFRSMFPAIAGVYSGAIGGRVQRKGGLWYALGRAAMAAVSEGGIHEAGRCRWMYSGSTLLCELPSGRRLHYQNARIEDQVPGYCFTLGLPLVPRATLVYDTPQGYSTSTYSAKLCENVDQATCRDIYAHSKVLAERAGLNVVMGVHDEIVCEVPDRDAESGLRELVRIMSTPPAWAAGFPLGCEGYTAKRYVKKPPKGSFQLHA